MGMRILATKQQDDVRQQPSDGSQRLNRPGGAAGQIDYKAGTAGAGKGARERGELAVALACAAHQFSETRDEATENGLSSFRRNVTQTQSGSARRQDNIHPARFGPRQQRPTNRRKAIRNNFSEYDPPAQFANSAGDGRAG